MTEKLVTMTIDETPVTVPADSTVMQAVATLGIHIPRLCFHPDLSLMGSCRVCIVEETDSGAYIASCAYPVREGLRIRTNSQAIRQARRDIVELLLDNHPRDCQTCERDGHCELQNLAYTLGVRERLFEGERKHFKTDDTSVSVVREPDKCVLCGRCVRVCAEVQGVYNLSQQGRGFLTVVSPFHGVPMDDSVCIQCGQCINVCPTASFLEKKAVNEVWAALADPSLHVVAQTAPSIRAAIGEGFGLPTGTPATGQMITALRRLGFEAVFDTDLGADLTIVEEANELKERLEGRGPLPMLTSCSPAWINFMERFYPELIPNASSCRSPMMMISVLLKTWYAQQKGLDPKKVFVVSVMPCVAKKFEARRPEHQMPGVGPYTDAVITTRELIWMIKAYGIQFTGLPEGAFDSPLGLATGAGDIFGTTGGVMEATLRTAGELLTGNPNHRLEFTEVRAVGGLREATVRLGDRELRVGVANGLQNAKTLLDKVAGGQEQFHVVEVMACPGGCIGGGGQPYPPPGKRVLDPERLAARARALYQIDGAKTLRRSHENPAVKAVYADFLGEIGGEKAHELLHTTYAPKLPRGIR